MKLSTGEKPFKCEYCGKAFRQKHSVSEHQRTHNREKPYLCTVCGVSFKIKQNLVFHKRIQFSLCFSFLCFCVHFARLGNRDTCFFCLQCEIIKNNEIKKCLHSTGENPFQCTFENCSEAFVQKSLLLNHLQNSHQCSLDQIQRLTICVGNSEASGKNVTKTKEKNGK